MFKQFELCRQLLPRKSQILQPSSFRRLIRRQFHPSVRLLDQKKNHYETLGVPKDADEKQIKQAFFKAAKKHHPDANPDDPNASEKFTEVNEAYQTLSNKNKRAEYDMFGSASGAAGGHPGFGGDGFEGMNVQDIFENLFGMGMKQKRGEGSSYGVHNEPGNDIQVEIDINFDDCLKEVKRDIRVNVEQKCGGCQGSGAKPGTSPVKCLHCQGSGMMQRQQGFMIMQTTCPYCHGEGVSITPCNTCDGQGLVNEKKTVAVSIPAGVEDNMRVRIPHQGGASRSKGQRGHVYLLCHVKPSRMFERIGSDLHIKMNVPLSMALLGGELEIKLPGQRSLKHNVKSGTQSGHIDTVRGKGFPDPRNGMNGHLYIHISVHIPTGLDEESKKLVEEFKKLELFKEPTSEKPDLSNERRKEGKQRYGFGSY